MQDPRYRVCIRSLNPVSCIHDPMTVLDYFVLLVVLASVASGATKGIIRVIISVAFTVAGLVLAAYSYEYAASVLRIFVAARIADLLGFVTMFVLVLIAGIASWSSTPGNQRTLATTIRSSSSRVSYRTTCCGCCLSAATRRSPNNRSWCWL